MDQNENDFNTKETKVTTVNSARTKRQTDKKNVAEHLKPHREPRLNRAKRHVRISGIIILRLSKVFMTSIDLKDLFGGFFRA